MCGFISWCKLDASAQAAWVQAVGSVLAILIAIAIPAIAAWRNSRNVRAARREKMLNAGIRILDPISSLRVSLAEFITANEIGRSAETDRPRIDPHDGDFQSLVPAVIASVAVLDDMGPLAPSLRELLFELIELDRMMKAITALQGSGYHAAWINNVDEISAKATSLMTRADAVVDALRGAMDGR